MVQVLGKEFGFDSFFVLQPVAGCVHGASTYDFPRHLPLRPWQSTYIPRLYEAIMRQAPASLNIADLCGETNAAMASGLKPFNAPLHLTLEGNAFVVDWIFKRMQQPFGRGHRS